MKLSSKINALELLSRLDIHPDSDKGKFIISAVVIGEYTEKEVLIPVFSAKLLVVSGLDDIKLNAERGFREDRPDAELGLKQVASPYPYAFPDKAKRPNMGQLWSVKADFLTYYEDTYTNFMRIIDNINRLVRYDKYITLNK